MTNLIAFPQDFHGSRLREVEIGNHQLRRLIGTCSGVVEEQKQSMVTPALGCAAVRSCQKGVHLVLFQIGHGDLGGLLEGDTSHFSTPCKLLRTVHANEIGQRMDGRQPLIASCDCTMSSLLKVAKEVTNMFYREMLNG